MRRLHWSCTLALSALFSGLSLAAEDRVPHSDRLVLGQGFNTFLGVGAMFKAVVVTSGQPPPVLNPPIVRRRDGPARGTGDAADSRLPFNFTSPSCYVPGSYATSEIGPSPLDKLHAEIDDYVTSSNGTGALMSKRSMDKACPDGQNSGKVLKRSRREKSYESYLKSLDVSASATISGYGQTASLTGNYLDQAQFAASDMTFLTIIEVRKQQNVRSEFQFQKQFFDPVSFHETHGDRFIRGFQAGGKLIARVSVYTKEKNAERAIGASVEVAVNALAASAGLSASAKQKMTELNKQARVKIDIFYEGDLARDFQSPQVADSADTNSVQSAFEEAKSWIQTFQQSACQHDYKYEAILEEYPKIPDFPRNEVKALDYRLASGEAFGVLKELVKITEMGQFLRLEKDMPEQCITEIRRLEEDMEQASRKWVTETARDPANARTTADALQRYFLAEFWESKSVGMRLIEAYQSELKMKGYIPSFDLDEIPTLLSLAKSLNKPRPEGMGNLFTPPRQPRPVTVAASQPVPSASPAVADRARYSKRANVTGVWTAGWCELDNGDAYSPGTGQYRVRGDGSEQLAEGEAAVLQKGDVPRNLEECLKNINKGPEEPKRGDDAAAHEKDGVGYEAKADDKVKEGDKIQEEEKSKGETTSTGETKIEEKGCDELKVTFRVSTTTVPGQTIKIVGNTPTLGLWDTNKAMALDASEYRDASSPTWKGEVSVKPGGLLEYKYIKVENDGSLRWETGANRVFEAPRSCETPVGPRFDASPTWGERVRASG